MISPSQWPLPDNTQHSQQTDIHASDRVRTYSPCKWATADPRLKVPIHVRVCLASPAGLGFQWVKLVHVWSVTSRTWPILAWLVRAFGGAWLAAGLLLARTCVGGPKPDSRIHTAINTDRANFVTKEEPCRLPCLKHSWVLTFWQSFAVFSTIISNKIQ
jgi:hypothetical protein